MTSLGERRGDFTGEGEENDVIGGDVTARGEENDVTGVCTGQASQGMTLRGEGGCPGYGKLRSEKYAEIRVMVMTSRGVIGRRARSAAAGPHYRLRIRSASKRGPPVLVATSSSNTVPPRVILTINTYHFSCYALLSSSCTGNILFIYFILSYFL